MKKVLIIGYGDIGRRISLRLPEQDFIGISRSIPTYLPNVEFIQLDWIKESSFVVPAENISAVVLILKPSSPAAVSVMVCALKKIPFHYHLHYRPCNLHETPPPAS